jgi:hypothetical protein
MQIEFNSKTGKWEARDDSGKLMMASSSKYYLKQKLGKPAAKFVAEQKPSEFSINERFDFVGKIVTMVASKTTASAIISGSGGMGKTFSVLEALKKAGMKDVTDLASFEVGDKLDVKKCFRVIKGYGSAKGLFRTLQECNGMTILMDDTDSVLKDPVALNLLKGALDSYGDRYVSWLADIRDQDLDRTFKFTGQIIFITNVSSEKLDQALKSRSMVVDLSMTREEMLERMDTISESSEFLPDLSKSVKRDAMQFMRENLDNIANLSLRTLIQVCKISASGDSSWKSLAKYVVSQGA